MKMVTLLWNDDDGDDDDDGDHNDDGDHLTGCKASISSSTVLDLSH